MTRPPYLWTKNYSLGIQSPYQMMIGVYNHLLSKVFWCRYHSQKVIGSLGYWKNTKHTKQWLHVLDLSEVLRKVPFNRFSCPFFKPFITCESTSVIELHGSTMGILNGRKVDTFPENKHIPWDLMIRRWHVFFFRWSQFSEDICSFSGGGVIYPQEWNSLWEGGGSHLYTMDWSVHTDRLAFQFGRQMVPLQGGLIQYFLRLNWQPSEATEI